MYSTRSTSVPQTRHRLRGPRGVADLAVVVAHGQRGSAVAVLRHHADTVVGHYVVDVVLGLLDGARALLVHEQRVRHGALGTCIERVVERDINI